MKKKVISSFEAKTNFSRILQDVITGNTQYIITLRGKQVATLSPYKQKTDTSLQDVINQFIARKKE